MKLYWPTAISVTDNGEPDICFTYSAAHSFDKAEEQFQIWEKNYKFRLAARWIEIYDPEANTREKSMRRIDMGLVKELWNSFTNIPVNNKTKCIESWWGSVFCADAFRPGTKVNDVCKWFEKTFGVTVEELIENED